MVKVDSKLDTEEGGKDTNWNNYIIDITYIEEEL